MENILLDLGVEHEDEAGMQRKVQELVQEAQTNTTNKNLPQMKNTNDSQRSKKSMLESILDGANAANDSTLTRSTRMPAKIGNIEERVKFISNIADIPNAKEKEQRFNSGKRGYYDAGTSLNLFSSSHSGQSNEYKSSTNIDDSLLKTIMQDAKKQRIKPKQNNTESIYTTLTEDSIVDDIVDTAFTSAICSNNDNVDSYNYVPYTTEIDVSPAVEKVNHSNTSSTDSDALLVCPFCNRDLQHLSTRSGAHLVEQHIDRCVRRGSRNVVNYAAVQSQEDEEAPTSSNRIARRSSRNSTVTSTSSMLSANGNEEGDEEEEEVLSEEEWKSSSRHAPSSSSSSGPTKKSKSGKGEPTRRSSLHRNNGSMNSLTSQNSGSNSKRVVETATVVEILDDDDVNSECSNDWVGSVASIVDDWEDEVYLARLEAIEKETRKEYKKKKKERSNMSAVDQDRATIERDSEYMRTDYGMEVLRRTWEKLHEYQQEGCRWLHRLYDEGVGGILGDEMGLGKTAQMCTHLGSLALLHNETHRSIPAATATASSTTTSSAIFIVVCPATVLHHWLQEFQVWTPFLRTVVLHSISATAAELLKIGNSGIPKVLKKLQKKRITKGLVVLTTYEGLRKYHKSLVAIEWTGVCLDEGQKIRNPNSNITSVCKLLPAFHRVILSGTPIQNSLRELWSLFDFIYPGRLGSLPVFESEFALPIRLGGYSNANILQYEIAIKCSIILQNIIKPYLLRRKKNDLLLITKLPLKTEQILFCQISPKQKDIYYNIINSTEVQAVLHRKILPFRSINLLRKLCNHPVLVYKQGNVHYQQDPLLPVLSKKNPGEGGEEDEDDEDDIAAYNLLNKVGSSGVVWADSGKLLVLSKLLPLWYTEGHKVLIFSQTRGMLSIIESMIRELGFLYLRLDGSTPIGKRAGIVNQFNSTPSIFVMLLTTRTGGVGISLTSANRVVLYDPDWNPMVDMQSRERAWRLGQTREVVVYRLITRGTIEEKIYQRQIFKLLLSNRILENAKQRAIFSQSHMKELFELNDSYSKGGQDRHGNMVGGEALPAGAEVHMSMNIPPKEQSLSQPNLSIRAEGEVEERALPGMKASKSTESLENSVEFLDVQDYVDAPPLSDEVVRAIEENEEPAADGSTSRDRRLLEALFAGDAITSVYDHHYFDPANSDQKANDIDKAGRLRRAAERVTVRDVASVAVTKALSELQSSAKVYQAPAPTPVRNSATSHSGGDIANPSNSSSSSSNNVGGGVLAGASQPGAPRPRFGTSSASMFGTSSASLLAGLASHNTTATTAQGSHQQLQTRPATSSVHHSTSTVTAAATSSSSSRQQQENSNTTPGRVSVKRDIADRLHALFANTDRPLSMVFVLSRFSDLGDQYAPLFRELLRNVAVYRNGAWIRK